MSQAAGPSAASPDIQLSGTGVSADVAASGLVDFISFTIGDDQYGVDIMAVRQIKGHHLRHSGSASRSNRKRSLNCDADAL